VLAAHVEPHVVAALPTLEVERMAGRLRPLGLADEPRAHREVRVAREPLVRQRAFDVDELELEGLAVGVELQMVAERHPAVAHVDLARGERLGEQRAHHVLDRPPELEVVLEIALDARACAAVYEPLHGRRLPDVLVLALDVELDLVRHEIEQAEAAEDQRERIDLGDGPWRMQRADELVVLPAVDPDVLAFEIEAAPDHQARLADLDLAEEDLAELLLDLHPQRFRSHPGGKQVAARRGQQEERREDEGSDQGAPQRALLESPWGSRVVGPSRMRVEPVRAAERRELAGWGPLIEVL